MNNCTRRKKAASRIGYRLQADTLNVASKNTLATIGCHSYTNLFRCSCAWHSSKLDDTFFDVSSLDAGQRHCITSVECLTLSLLEHASRSTYKSTTKTHQMLAASRVKGCLYGAPVIASLPPFSSSCSVLLQPRSAAEAWQFACPSSVVGSRLRRGPADDAIRGRFEEQRSDAWLVHIDGQWSCVTAAAGQSCRLGGPVDQSGNIPDFVSIWHRSTHFSEYADRLSANTQ